MGRRGHGEGTISKHATRDLWMARLRVGDRRIAVYGKTRAEARRKLDEAKRQSAILGAAPEPKTLGHVLDTWLASEDGRLSASTLAAYRHWSKTIRVEIGDRTPIDRITPPRVEMLLASYRGRPRGALYVYQTLHRAFAHTVRWGWLAANPVDRVNRPRYKVEERAVWAPEQARRFLDSAGRWRTLWLVAMASGCRPGELRGLLWGDVDFEAGTITVRRSVTCVNGYDVHTEGKTKRSRRTITLEPEAMAALRDWKRQQAKELLHLGARNPKGSVWTSEDGTLVTYSPLLHAFKRDARRAGLEGTPYLMRHWHASMLLGDGEPVPDVSARLGHANPHITMTTYAHAIPGRRQAPKVLGHVLKEADAEAAE